LIDELPAALSERLHLPVERYQALKNVDVSANARAAGAENSAHVLADLVGLATHLIRKDEVEASLLPPALTKALAFRKRQPIFMAAAALLVLALFPPLIHLHHVTSGRLERVSQIDSQLMPLRALEYRIAENLRQIDVATKQITALRGAYETKANWINFLADIQERLLHIEDVWLDKLQVVRAPAPELDVNEAIDDPGQENMAAAEEGQEPVETNPPPDAAPVSSNRPPVRLTLSGRLLDVANPQSKVSPESLQRVKELLASFTGSHFIAAIENERFDTNQNGLLKFDVTLVINPQKTL
jgi:type IV pilus assembly protein PilM